MKAFDGNNVRKLLLVFLKFALKNDKRDVSVGSTNMNSKKCSTAIKTYSQIYQSTFYLHKTAELAEFHQIRHFTKNDIV